MPGVKGIITIDGKTDRSGAPDSSAIAERNI
jgi:hypothetical protein